MEIILALGVLLVLMSLRVPIAFSLLAAGAFGLLILDGPRVAMSSLASVPYTTLASSTLIVIPMFVALGMFAKNAGIAERLFQLIQKYSHRLPGGLAVATIATSAGFGAVSGSSVATVSTIGRLSMSEMLRNGYNPGFAAGTLAAGGTLGIIIPPSIALVIYGSVTGESIGKLLIAGIVPGLITAVAYATYVVVRSVKDPEAAGRTRRGDTPTPLGGSGYVATTSDRANDATVLTAVATAAPTWTRLQIRLVVLEILVLFSIVIGGIYSGLATPSEAASVGAAVAFLLMCFDLRKRGPKGIWQATKESMRETISVTVMIFGLLIGAGVFSTFIVRSGLPRMVVEAITGANLEGVVIVVLILILLIPLGMFVDGMSMILITMPLAYPVISELGFDGIWFGILAIKLIELGLLTPPVGLNAFVAAKSAPGLTPEIVFKGVAPYWGVELAVTALLFAVPAITLWLPGLGG